MLHPSMRRRLLRGTDTLVPAVEVGGVAHAERRCAEVQARRCLGIGIEPIVEVRSLHAAAETPVVRHVVWVMMLDVMLGAMPRSSLG